MTIKDIEDYINDKWGGEYIRGYKPYYDFHAGSFGWWPEDVEGAEDKPTIWATPNWDDTGDTPFAVDYPDGAYEAFATIKFDDSTPLEYQLRLYFSTLALIIESVDPTIVVATTHSELQR